MVLLCYILLLNIDTYEVALVKLKNVQVRLDIESSHVIAWQCYHHNLFFQVHHIINIWLTLTLQAGNDGAWSSSLRAMICWLDLANLDVQNYVILVLLGIYILTYTLFPGVVLWVLVQIGDFCLLEFYSLLILYFTCTFTLYFTIQRSILEEWKFNQCMSCEGTMIGSSVLADQQLSPSTVKAPSVFQELADMSLSWDGFALLNI